MSEIGLTGAPSRKAAQSSWLVRLAASSRFQKWAARFPLTRRIVRSEGDAMFDLVAGFCHSQILQALVLFDVPKLLLERPRGTDELAQLSAVPLTRMGVLLQGGVALGLLKRQRQGVYGLTIRGAALAAVPGLQGMIRHHDVLYRDLADPVAFFRGETETELADFWPYVFGAGGATNPDTAATYSKLMADSQTLVAQDTLATIDLSQVVKLMDVGGGTGAFLTAVGQQHSGINLTLFDLPAVVPVATARFAAAGLAGRSQVVPGSFRDEPLPKGADMISLVRVLYDHADDTVALLLRAAFDALPAGGRIVISEPMTGGATPNRSGDAYFSLYCMAMRTGKARSAGQISNLLAEAGFVDVRKHKSQRPFVTSVVSAVRSS